MSPLIGEYDCKLDSKGRFRVPTQLLNQFERGVEFVVNRGIERCLNLYPKNVWDEMVAQVNLLNPYVKKNRQFIRFVYRGASEAKPDGSDRILLNKGLMEHAGLTKNIVLFAVNNYIEIWDKDRYNAEMSLDPEEVDGISDLAEEVSARFNYPENKKNDDDKTG